MVRAVTFLLLASRVAGWGGRGRIDNSAILEKKKLESLEWLERNAKEPDVVSLPSGLQYKVLASGPLSGARPNISDHITCHYKGSLIDGTVFENTLEKGEPYETQPSRLIAGWTEALQLMRPGDRWMVYIPATLAYADDADQNLIPPHSTIIFDLQLLTVEPTTSVFAGMTWFSLDSNIYGDVKVGHIAVPFMSAWFVLFVFVMQHDFKDKVKKTQ